MDLSARTHPEKGRGGHPMLRKSILIILILILAGLAQGQEFAKVGTMGAQFLKIDMDAKSAAMGSASMAFSNDAGAMFRNPAGLIYVRNSSFVATYAPWFADINLYGAAFAHNFGPYGIFGIHFIHLNSGQMDETTVDQQQGTGRTFSTGDLVLGLSYARNLTDKFAIGGNMRWIHEDLWISKSNVFGVDIGFLYDTGFKTLRMGMSVKNFGSKFNLNPNSYLDFDNGDTLSTPSQFLQYDLPIEFVFGLSADPFKNAMHRVSVAADAIHPSDNLERIQLGAEYAYQEKAFLRAGYIFRHDTAGLNAGAGVMLPLEGYRLGVDYAFSNFTILDNVHRFTLRFEFGAPKN
jgi:hypothetical protein